MGSAVPPAPRPLLLLDRGRPVEFTVAKLMRYGSASPGGVAHAFRVLERAHDVLRARHS
jgi:hypothetical protein